MSSTAIPSQSRPQPGILRLGFEVPSIEGDRLVAIVELVRARTDGHVGLEAIDRDPARLHFAGPLAQLEGLRTAVLDDVLHPAIGSRVMSLQIDPLPATPRSRAHPRAVLWVDGDLARAHRASEILGRAGLDAYVVGGIEAAKTLLLHTEVSFDAVVLHHTLPDGHGLDLLEAVPVDTHGASVLVFDEVPCSTRARAYRSLGACRYAASPSEALVLIGRVHAAILDTHTWRCASEPYPLHAGAPPRQFLDPHQAADRLRYLCRLSAVEREVVYWMLLGLRDADIARMLRRSERTAKRHVGIILDRAGVRSRAGLWAVLYRDGSEPGMGEDPGLRDAANEPPSVPLHPVDE